MADKYVYPYSAAEAKRLGELDEWRASHKANKECAAAIDKAVRERFDGMNLPGDIAENACREFGIDRVKWVLANTVQHADWDGRYRPHNKEWAAKTYIPRNAQNDNTTEFILQSHPEIINELVNQYRRFYDGLNLFDKNHCVEGSRDMDYQYRLLVLKPEVLRDENKTPDDQIFYAKAGGFGCKPGNHGKVMGEFLVDGEETNFHRDDFIGILQNEHFPDWAMEKYHPPLRSILVHPGKAPVVCEIPDTKIYDALCSKKVENLGVMDDIGSVNVYYNPSAAENGQPFNCTISDTDFYGTILINGMRDLDRSLTDRELEAYLDIIRESQSAIQETDGMTMQ